jgi:hypothetical protein
MASSLFEVSSLVAWFGRVSARRPTHFLLLRQEKVSKEKASRSQGRYAVPCAARVRWGRVQTRFAQTCTRPYPPATALLSPVTTALDTKLRSLVCGIVNSQYQFPLSETVSAARPPSRPCRAAQRRADQGGRMSERSEFATDPARREQRRVPRSGTVSGSPSLCLLSLGEARESESPAGAKPGLQRNQEHFIKKQTKRC